MTRWWRQEALPLALLAVVSVGMVTAHLVLFAAAPRTIGTDESVHLHHALDVAVTLGAETAPGTVAIPNHYPPLVTGVMGILFRLFGYSELLAFLVIGAFLPVLLVSLYGLSRSLALGRWVSLAAALSVLLVPQLMDASRQVLLDFPLAAMCALAAWAMVASDDFRDRTGALLFGVAAGLAMLTKWTAPQVLLPLVLVIVVRSVRRREAVVNLVLATLVAAVVAGSWYGPHIGEVLETATVHGLRTVGPAEVGIEFPSLLTVRAWTLYGEFLGRLLSGPLTLLLLLAFGLAAVTRERRLVMVVFWFAGGYLLMTLLPPKEPRFLLPLLPVAGVAAGVVLGWTGWSTQGRQLLLAALLLAAFALYPRPSVIRPPAPTGLVEEAQRGSEAPGNATLSRSPKTRWSGS